MTRSLASRHSGRLTRFLLALALVGSAALFCGVSTTHAAKPASICVHCPPPPLQGPSISVSSNGLGALTVAGQHFTPGGQVKIVANMPFDNMGGGGTTNATAVASLAFYNCYLPYGCFLIYPGGTFSTTFGLTFSCGSGIYPVTVQALDVSTNTWSNPVSIFPWSTC